MSDTVSFMNERGLIETVNIYTGEVLAVQATKDDIFKSKLEKMTQVALPDGSLVWVEKGISLDNYVKKTRWTYSDVMIDIICVKILEGKLLGEICKEVGMPPYHVLSRWLRKYPEAKEKIQSARTDYAELMAEEVLVEAMRAEEDTINETKVKVDALKYLASVNNDRFNPKQKVQHEGTVVTQLVVDTGIRRNDDSAIPDNSREVGELHGSDRNQAEGAIIDVSGGGDAASIDNTSGPPSPVSVD